MYADLDGDGTPESAWLEGAVGRRGFSHLSIGDAEGRELFRTRPAKLWKLLLADVEGDGTAEIVVAGVGKSKGRAGEANGLHVYKWDGAAVVPVWRGSALSMPFRDVDFADWDSDGQGELVSLEINPESKSPYLVIYRWTGFGFAGEVRSALPDETFVVSLFRDGSGDAWEIILKNGDALDCRLVADEHHGAGGAEDRRAVWEMSCAGRDSGHQTGAAPPIAALRMDASVENER